MLETSVKYLISSSSFWDEGGSNHFVTASLYIIGRRRPREWTPLAPIISSGHNKGIGGKGRS